METASQLPKFLPLLPKPRAQDWLMPPSSGLHPISNQDYQRNLCENYFDASVFGTPSPLAQTIVFKERLEQFLLDHQSERPSGRFDDAFETWSLFLKALYLQVITYRPIELGKLGELGRIIAWELPQGFPLKLLSFEGKVIGMTYPTIAFAPSARFDDALRSRLMAAVERRDVQVASQYFGAWLSSLPADSLVETRFFSLLLRFAEEWSPESSRPDHLPREPEKLFGPMIDLGLDEGPQGSGVGELVFRLPVYIGAPIVCESCGTDLASDREQIEITHPDDGKCPKCGQRYDWLGPYKAWIRFNGARGSYVIYAFDSSPIRTAPLSKSIEYHEDGVIIRSPSIDIRIPGLVLTEEKLRCDRLTFFVDGDSEKAPDLPIRGEYFGLVKLDDRQRPYLDRATGDYRVVLRAEGWPEPIVINYSSKEIQRQEALVVCWPRFELKGWNIQYYLLEADPEMYQAGIKLRALTRSGRPRLLETTRGALEKPAEAYDIVFAREGKIEGHAGIFLSHRNEIPRGDSALTLALDFGTSSSAVWYRLGEGSAKPLRFRDYTETVVPHRAFSDRILTYSNWLPTYRLDDPITARQFYRAGLEGDEGLPMTPETLVSRLDYFLPSELVVWPPLSAEAFNSPLHGFRLWHSLAAIPQGEVVFELKTLDVEGNAEGRFRYEQAVAAYLETFLIQALAAVSGQEELAGQLNIRASFPRAFSAEKLRAYDGCLRRVIKRLEKLTGFVTAPPIYLDETRAAALSLPTAEGIVLVMDMGGGTTDIGVFEWKRDKLEPLYSDSLMYAGNSFLRLLCTERQSDLFPRINVPRGARIDNDGVSLDRLMWLLREIRLRGFQEVVRSQYKGSVGSKRVMQDLLLRFYAPVATFVRRLFEALGQDRYQDTKAYLERDLAFYMVGNGWGLGDAIPPAFFGGDREGFSAVMTYLLRQEGFAHPNPAQQGELRTGNMLWPGPKSAIGAGTISAEERDLYRDAQEAAGDLHGVRSIAGFDFRMTDGSSEGGGQQVQWNEAIPLRIATPEDGDWRDRPLRPVFGGLEIPEKWDFIQFRRGSEVEKLEQVCRQDILRSEEAYLTRSVLVRFLETVYRPQLERARR